MASSQVKRPQATFSIWLATGLGLGLYAPAPGTIGALWGIPLYAAISQLPGLWWERTLVVTLALACIPLASRAAQELVSRGFPVDPKDPQPIVADEYLTVPIVYTFAPQAWGDPIWIAFGFALHRLFDISKPWPCRQLERLPGGLGITADDIMASLYAGLIYGLAWQGFGT